MGPAAQLANYFWGVIINLGLAGLFIWLYFKGIHYHISYNARLALLGLSLGFIHWGIHQAWFGRRWWLRVQGSEDTYWYLQNSWILSFSYILLCLSAVICTTAILRGRFVDGVTQFVVLAVVWLVIAGIGYKTALSQAVIGMVGN